MRHLRIPFLLILCLLTPGLCQASTAQVTLNDSLSVIQVRYGAGSGPLEVHSQEIWDSLTMKENGRRVGRMLVPVETDKPVVYEVDLRHSGPQWGISRWHAPLRLADWHDWLLTPLSWEMTKPLDLYLRVAPSVEVAMPFERIQGEPGQIRYRAYPILPGHGGLTLFGNVATRTLNIGHSRVELAVAGADAREAGKLFTWAERVLATAVDVHGAAPGHASILMIPVPLVRGAVPWAHVRRGGGSHIIAYVKQGLDAETLDQDWTLFHEVMHLYHPYLHSGGRWISEGFASYFQNVYQARAGVVSPDFAFSQLQAGLERGRRENESSGHRPVTQGGRMRTYWTGAALAFQADALLREEASESTRLASAIGGFASQRLPASRSWHPRDYLQALDAELGQPLLVELYDGYVRDRFFPEPEMAPETWQQIFGIE